MGKCVILFNLEKILIDAASAFFIFPSWKGILLKDRHLRDVSFLNLFFECFIIIFVGLGGGAYASPAEMNQGISRPATISTAAESPAMAKVRLMC